MEQICVSSSWCGWQVRGQGQPILPGLAICDGDDLDTNAGYLDGMGSIPGVRSVWGSLQAEQAFLIIDESCVACAAAQP